MGAQVFGSKHSIQAHTIQQRKQEARQAGRQDGRQAGRQAGGQAETRGDKTSGRWTHHLAPGTHVGRQSETRGDKTSGRQTQSNTDTYVGRQWETRGNKGRQDLGKADTLGHKGRQDRGTADTPSNTGTHVGKQWETMGEKGKQGETRPREGGHTIQHRHKCGERMGDNGRPGKTRQDLGKADTPSNTKVDTLRRQHYGSLTAYCLVKKTQHHTFKVLPPGRKMMMEVSKVLRLPRQCSSSFEKDAEVLCLSHKMTFGIF